MSFFEELKRRNVVRVGIAYAVAAWLLLQLTEVLTELLELPTTMGKTVIALLLIGFPLALIFAWAFELTPEGVKREKDVDRSDSIAPKTGKKLDRIIIVGLVLIIIGMGIERAWFAGRSITPSAPTEVTTADGGPSDSVQAVDRSKTVAVLPFADMSQEQNQGWFADGLAEEILNALARAPDLLVSSRTSSFAYKGSNAPLAQIATELGVEHVLEGSVRRAGDRIRVTAQLIRASDGFHVWSENYDRNADDVIAMQEELAVSIAKALKTTMDPRALAEMLGAGTRSVDAYEKYLNGLALESRAFESGNWDLLRQAYELYEQARAIDPGFSSAHYRAAEFWRDQISISRRSSNLSDTTHAERMAPFTERIEAAIETAGNAVDRIKYEAFKAYVEMRIRDTLRLAGETLEARPHDLDAMEVLLYASTWVQDISAQEAALKQTVELMETGNEYLDYFGIIGWRHEYPGVGLSYVDFVKQKILTERHNNGAYQAYRGLLWMGERELAEEVLPVLSGLTGNDRLLVDARQACAEGRRSEVEKMLAESGRNTELPPDELASLRWHLLRLLGRSREAHEQLKPFESAETPLTVGAYLVYPDFDPSYFPVIQNILRREGYRRPAPRPFPLECPEQDVVQQESVAVLPFIAMSSGEDDEYFADGLTEEILNSLAGLPELLVTARTSSFHFKGKDLPIPEIAKTLGVDHVVEGSVRRAGERVRITAQLIRAEDGFHLWSDTYDRTLEDIFAVQEDIAENIAETLDVVLDEDKRQRMRNAGIGDVEAFIAYQKGVEAFVTAHNQIEQGSAKLAAAVEYFDQALEAAPDLVAARLMKADQRGHVILELVSGLRKETYDGELQAVLDDLREEYRLAIEAAPPGNQRDILQLEATLFSDDWSNLQVQLERALAPGGCATMNWSSDLFRFFGYAEQAIPKMREILRCDPLNFLGTFGLTSALMATGQADEAVAATQAMAERGIASVVNEQLNYLAHLAAGHLEAPEVKGQGSATGLFIYDRQLPRQLLLGNREAALRMAEEYQNGPLANDWTSMVVAAMLGDRERANQHAARLDTLPGSAIALINGTYVCACGAAFDLDATPNLKRRIEQSGLNWSPPAAIQFPGKDW